jgi:hypothetical protein
MPLLSDTVIALCFLYLLENTDRTNENLDTVKTFTKNKIRRKSYLLKRVR